MSRQILHLAKYAVVFVGGGRTEKLGNSGVAVLIVQPNCFVDVEMMAKLAMTPMLLSDLQVARGEPVNAPHLITGLFLKCMQDAQQKVWTRPYRSARNAECSRGKAQKGSGSWTNVVFSVLDSSEAAWNRAPLLMQEKQV